MHEKDYFHCHLLKVLSHQKKTGYDVTVASVTVPLTGICESLKMIVALMRNPISLSRDYTC